MCCIFAHFLVLHCEIWDQTLKPSDPRRHDHVFAILSQWLLVSKNMDDSADFQSEDNGRWDREIGTAVPRDLAPSPPGVDLEL